MIFSNRYAREAAGFSVGGISRIEKGCCWQAGAAGCCNGPASRMSAWM